MTTKPQDMENMEIVAELEAIFDPRTVELIRVMAQRIAHSVFRAEKEFEGKKIQ